MSYRAKPNMFANDLRCLAYQFILGLPASNTVIPIVLPTLYLWIVDTLALKRGTWVINHGTKLGIHLWDGLELEEALFFLVSNMLIVFGQIAFDNALSILTTFPSLFPTPSTSALPSPALLMRALLMPATQYDEDSIKGLKEAVQRLKKKSRSFYLASGMFQGQIRTDLLLLYSFCRVADDLVDEAASADEARSWISKLQTYLAMAYEHHSVDQNTADYVRKNFDTDCQSALLQLPVSKLSRQPLEDLLRGFEMDICFAKEKVSPVHVESDLDLYAHRVAGTVAHMCIELIFHDCDGHLASDEQRRVIDAGDRMGVALQCVNIARDIAVDANMGRVYIPQTWLKDEGMSADSILKNPHGPGVEKLRRRLLTKAFALHKGARHAIEELPVEARGPLRVAVESYMEIGRVLRQEGYLVKAGRATVPKLRRLRVAWNTLREK
jgi:15-cis-phytoene synthase/lycopene beta-cyclase